jgi:hypothetical protein
MDQFNSARSVAHILIGQYKKEDLNSEILESVIENVFKMPGFDQVDKEELLAQLEADLNIYSGKATELVEKEVIPWLNAEKANIKWSLWDRYKMYLRAKDASFPIDSVDDLTDRILDKCINPKTSGSWDRRGMVVGNVQSGKTANYTGLVNKATDAGYKLIIIIAGIHNSLRAQTQLRVDEGYIGRKSADFIKAKKNVKVGVGAYDVDTEIYSYTSSDEKGDFSRSIASKINVPIGGSSPTVLVIKKNKSILENLILWLNQFADDVNGERKIINVPLLVIDDEADNASVNSGTEEDVKTINRLIRTLLNLFNRNTFIGYTATPYANLFIPSSWSEDLETNVRDLKLKVGEDLFPRDFIVNIPPPSNYIGAIQVFGFVNENTGEEHEGLNIIRYAEDQEPYFPKKINKDNQDDLPDDLPSSLNEAIKAFILTNAIRRLRGHEKKHSSMLVHVALRVKWIDCVAWLVNEKLRSYKNQIKSGQGNILNELKELYKRDFVPTTIEVKENMLYHDPKVKPHNWDEVKEQLIPAVLKIDVRAVHGVKNTSGLEYDGIQELNYDDYKENGLCVIAVGGNKLARGITLEGLSISYYLRTTRMYDSLMQMGRWFGYRPGYVDLCRLYTTSELVKWYRHVTLATEEMRDDFDAMAKLNKRPADYQLKVRTHPGMLAITSLSKMRGHEKISVGYSGGIIQMFEHKKTDISKNFTDFKFLISRLPEPEKLTNNNGVNALLWRDVSSEKVKDFLSTYRNDFHNLEVITAYIQKQNENGLFNEWSVAISVKPNALNDFTINWMDENFKVGMSVRSLKDINTPTLNIGGGKNAILFQEHKLIDLNGYYTEKPTSEEQIKELRKKYGKPLLVVIPIDPSSVTDIDHKTPIIGLGIVFPIIDSEKKYEYAARPLRDYEEELQLSDDPADEE